jgi:ABC-type branched-subunit amino acid transport system substrate-binding protein
MLYEEVFAISPSNTGVNLKVVEWVKDAGFKSIAMMMPPNDYGINCLEVFEEKYKELGIEYKTVLTPLATNDFTTQLLKWKDFTPDLFQAWIYGPAQYRLVNQSVQSGFAPNPKTVMYGTIDCLHPEFWETCKESGKYVIATRMGLPKVEYNETTKHFIKTFQEKYERFPTAQAMEAYDSLMLMVEAIKTAGSTDADSIIDTLETKIDWLGARGRYNAASFRKEKDPDYLYHQWMDFPMHLVQFTEYGQNPEQAEIIWPGNWKTVEGWYVPVPTE